MRKVIFLSLVLFIQCVSYAESQGAQCENRGGIWKWNGSINQWQCDENGQAKIRDEEIQQYNSCKNGDPKSCYFVAQKMDMSGNPNNLKNIIALYNFTCNSQNDFASLACGELSTMYHYGSTRFGKITTQKNIYLAAQYEETACRIDPRPKNTLGISQKDSCYFAGDIYREIGDSSKALDLFRESCRRGYNDGCHEGYKH